MDGLSIDHYIPSGGECNQGQIVAVERPCRLDKGGCLPVVGFRRVNLVGDLDEFERPVLVAYDDVLLFGPWISRVVVNVAEVIGAAAQQFDVDYVLKTPADVFTGHRILPVVLKPRIDDV